MEHLFSNALVTLELIFITYVLSKLQPARLHCILEVILFCLYIQFAPLLNSMDADFFPTFGAVINDYNNSLR